VQTQPKPVGIVNYNNSNGYNIAKKYIGDAGLTFAIRQTSGGSGEGYSYTTITPGFTGKNLTSIGYGWSGFTCDVGLCPAAYQGSATCSSSCTSSGCTSFIYTQTCYTGAGGTGSSITVNRPAIDVIWAPDINATTCQGIDLASTCYD